MRKILASAFLLLTSSGSIALAAPSPLVVRVGVDDISLATRTSSYDLIHSTGQINSSYGASFYHFPSSNSADPSLNPKSMVNIAKAFPRSFGALKVVVYNSAGEVINYEGDNCDLPPIQGPLMCVAGFDLPFSSSGALTKDTYKVHFIRQSQRQTTIYEYKFSLQGSLLQN